MKNIYKNAEMHSVDLFYNLRFLCLLVLMACLSLTGTVRAQNAIVGSGWQISPYTAGWGGGSCPTGNTNFNYLANTVSLPTGENSWIGVATPQGTAPQYWRYGIDWSGTESQWTITNGSNTPVSPSTQYSLSTSCTTSGALYYSANSSYNYIFKTLNASASPTGSIAFFEVQGTVRTVSSVSQSPTSANVYINQPVVVSAVMSGALPTGQAAYVRYTTNGWTSTSVVPMTLSSGSTYTASIPGSAGSTAVSYFVFTSGPSNVASNGSNANLFTINYSAASSYTVNNSYLTYTSVAGGGPWGTANTWVGSAVPISASYVNIVIASTTAVTLNQSAITNSITVNSSCSLTCNNATNYSLTAATVNNSGTITLGVNATTAGDFTWTNCNVLSGGLLTNNAGSAAALAVTNFSVANGGSYTHGATGSTANGVSTDFPGSSSITLGATSTVTITSWANAGTTPAALPSGVSWGNLILNIPSSGTLAGTWQQAGGITNIQGNFTVTRLGGSAARVFAFASTSTTTVSIGGNLTVTQDYLGLCNGSGAVTVNVAGSVSVTGGQLRLTSGAGSAILNIAGNYTQSGGTTSLALGAGNGTLNLTSSASTFSLTGGNFYYNNGSNPTTIVNLAGSFSMSTTSAADTMDFSYIGVTANNPGVLNVAGNFTLSGGAVIRSSVTNNTVGSLGSIVFDGGAQTLTASAWTGISDSVSYIINSGSTVTLGSSFDFSSNNSTPYASFTVNSGGTLNFGAYNLNDGTTGTGDGVFLNNGTLIMGDPNGISIAGANTGNVRVGSSATYHTTASCNYTYAGSGAQVTGTGLPASLAGTLTISNSSGVTLSQATTVTGASSALSFTAGLLSLSNFNLTLGSTSTLSGYGSSSYIQTNGTGQFKQTLPLTTQVFFPVGNAAYDPFWMTCSGTAGVYGIICNNSIVPAVNNPNEVVNRSWTIYEATAGGTITPKAQWNSPAEEASGFAAGITPYFGMYNGSAWLINAATLSSPTMTASTGFAIPAINTPYIFAVGKDNCFNTPTITLSDPSSVSAGNITQSTTNNVIGAFALTVTSDGNDTLTGMTVSTTGTYNATDLTNIKLWYQSTSTFNAGTATLLSTITSPTVAGSHTFPSFTAQTLVNGTISYFFITTDLACATAGNTVKITTPTSTNFTFSQTPSSFSGTASANGTQTIIAATPANASSPSATPSGSSVSLSWSAPTGCYSDVMILVSASSSLGWTPTNGSTYSGGSLTYGSGTAEGSGYIVYEGNGSPETVTGLLGGTTYYATFFTRNGTTWSSGVQISFVTTTSTNNTWIGGTSNDWNTASNWSLARVPLSTDTVIISTAVHNPCVINSGSYSCYNFTVSGTGNFQMASGTTLTVNGTISITSSVTPTFNCSSTLNLASTGTVTVPAENYGSLNLTGGNRILASSGTIGICNTYTPGTGTITVTGSTVNYDGTGAQTVTASTYNNLTISGARTTNSVTLDSSSFGSRIIDIAGTFSPTMTFTTGAIINSADTINFSSASSQPMPAFYYGSVENHAVGNTFVNAGGARVWASSGVIDINALFIPSTGTNTITGSIVRYSSSTGINTYPLVNVNSNITGYDYNYLSFSGSDQWYQAPGVNLAVYADDSISGTGIQLVNNSASGDSLKVNGNLIVNGNFTITGNSGSGVANVAGNVTVTSTPGSITIGGGTTTGGVLNVTGTSSVFTNTGNIFVLSGSAGAGTLTMTGASSSFSQTGNGVLYMNAGTSATAEPLVKFAGAVTLTSTNINWNSVLTNTGRGGSIYVGGNFSIAAGSMITFGQAQYSNGVIHFNGTSPQTISCITKVYIRRVNFVIDSGSYCTLSNNFHIQSYNATAQNDSFIVSSGATLNLGTYMLSDTSQTTGFTSGHGRGTFINNGTLIIGDPNGINPTGASTGNIRVGGSSTGAAIYNNTVACNYTYAGTTLQNTGTGLPTTINGNLTINNSAGVQLAESITENDSLEMLSGNLDLNGSFNMTLGPSAIFTGESCSNSLVNTGSPTTGNGYIGTTRTLGAYAGNVGNIGITLYNTGSLGSTLIRRFPNKSITAINTSYNSISRIYEVKPTTNSSGYVTVAYCNSDLNGNTQSNPNLGVYSTTSATSETSNTGYVPNYVTAFDNSADTVLSALPLVSLSTTNGTYITCADIDQYCTQSNGDWNIGSTWSGGIVPPANANICISNLVTVAQANTATTGNVTIYSGASLTISSPYEVNVGAGKTFINNSSTASLGATGTVNFLGAGTIAGSLATTFGNMLVNAGMTLTTVPTISDTLRINNGGYFNQSPIYGSSSFLVYNIVSSSYTVNNEWSANGSTAGTGIPQNVIVQNGTTLNMPTTSRGLAGNLYITSGTLALNSTSGDIYVAGNWTRNSSATFTPNSRAVFFDGTGTQVVTVTGGGAETFNYLLVTGSGTMKLSSSPATNVVVNSSGGLTLGSSNSTSTIDLNGQTLTPAYASAGNLSLSSGNRYITSSTGTGIFKVTTSVPTLSSLGTLTFASGTTLDLQIGFDGGATGAMTMNGTLEIDPNGYMTNNGHAPTYGSTSTLNYNTGGTYTPQPSSEWYENTYSQPGVPYNVTITTSGTAVNFSGEGNPHEMWGNLTINSGTSLSLNSSISGADFKIKGNWTNSGTFNCGGRLVLFEGLSGQTMTGATTFDYLQLSNSSGLTLSNDATVNSQLILTSGVISTGTNKVAVLSSSSTSVTGNSSSSYINGNIRRYVTASGNYDLPVGTASNYQLANITFNSSLSGTTTYLDAKFNNATPIAPVPTTCVINNGMIGAVLPQGSWTIVPDVEPNSGATYTATLNMTGVSSGLPSTYVDAHGHTILPQDQIGLVKKDATINSGNWTGCGLMSGVTQPYGTQIQSTQSTTSNTATVVRSGIPSFSDFAIGVEQNQNWALPVQLIYFTAVNDNNNAALTWATASEINNAYFEIDRSLDAVTFDSIGQVAGHGNSEVTINYSYSDPDISLYNTSILYYRLKQVDVDGNFTYSNIAAVNVADVQQVFNIISTYPNPFSDHFSVSFFSPASQTVKVSVYDVRGALVSEEIINAELGMNVYSLPDPSLWASGFYSMSINTGSQKYTVKMLKTE